MNSVIYYCLKSSEYLEIDDRSNALDVMDGLNYLTKFLEPYILERPKMLVDDQFLWPDQEFLVGCPKIIGHRPKINGHCPKINGH